MGYITFIPWLLPQQPWYKSYYHVKSRLHTPVWGSLRSPNDYKNGSHYRASEAYFRSFQKQNREEGETE